jgi:hypothetical protein
MWSINSRVASNARRSVLRRADPRVRVIVGDISGLGCERLHNYTDPAARRPGSVNDIQIETVAYSKLTAWIVTLTYRME